MTRSYDKLVRDDIPSVIEADGDRAVIHRVSGPALEARLHDKLEEEHAEFREETVLEELADVLEVVYALGAVHGWTQADLETARRKKTGCAWWLRGRSRSRGSARGP